MTGSTGAARRLVRAARRARQADPVTFQPAALGEATADRLTTAKIHYIGRTRAGVRINADNALTISAVWACIRFLSQSIASLPWQVIDDKTKLPVSMSVPTQRVLDRPSPEWSSFQFRETLLSWALRHGNGYAEIERDIIGNVRAMHPLSPDRVMVMRDNETGELYYSVDRMSRRTNRFARRVPGRRSGHKAPCRRQVVNYASGSSCARQGTSATGCQR